MSTISTVDLWEPHVLGRNRLNDVWWAFLVQAPFDMPSDLPELMGSRVMLDGAPFRIGGSVANVPGRAIGKGDPIQLLVSSL